MFSKHAFLPVLLLMASCAPQESEPVTDASVRLPAVKGNPGAAYFTLHGGKAGRTLVSVASPDAGRAEMHDMTMKDGMMMMTPITSVAIPKDAEVQFAPGGKHVMLFDLKAGLKAGDTIALSFTFKDGQTSQITATAEAPGGGDAHGH